MAIQRINFQSLGVVDQDRAMTFYCDVLGFNVHTDAPFGEGYRWISLTIDGADTKLHFARANEVTYDNVPALCLVCDSVDDEAARLGKLNVEITNGPDDAPWASGVRWLTIKDTEGNSILMESLKNEEV